MKPCALILALVAFLSLPLARADELKLKDGTEIVGTIVGFEENSFRVKTSYGFAVVQKDQVVSISIANTAVNPAPEEKPVPVVAIPLPGPAKAQSSAPAKKNLAATAQAPAKPVAKRETVAASASPQPASPGSLPSKPTSALISSTGSEKRSAVVSATMASPGKTTAVAPPAAANSPKQASPAVSASAAPMKNHPATVRDTMASPATAVPPPPAIPAPVREKVVGNMYTNETYGFQMYKPPDWDVIQGARALLPGAIAAMGTDDQSTYLLIGLEPGGKSIPAERSATQNRLASIMDNFRPLGEERVNISGISGIEDHFRGDVDGHDWSGVAVFLPRGTRLYTIFGMTIADTDLVQIQENVIARTISSLEFIQP
jgi:hypothetical protein